MSEEKHTPLPWVGFSDQGKCIAIMPAGRPGDVCSFNVKPSNADADLILRSVNSLPALVKALESIRMQDIGKDLYLGVISEDGCWSVTIPDDGKHIFRQWFESVTTALASVRSAK